MDTYYFKHLYWKLKEVGGARICSSLVTGGLMFFLYHNQTELMQRMSESAVEQEKVNQDLLAQCELNSRDNENLKKEAASKSVDSLGDSFF